MAKMLEAYTYLSFPVKKEGEKKKSSSQFLGGLQRTN